MDSVAISRWHSENTGAEKKIKLINNSVLYSLEKEKGDLRIPYLLASSMVVVETSQGEVFKVEAEDTSLAPDEKHRGVDPGEVLQLLHDAVL